MDDSLRIDAGPIEPRTTFRLIYFNGVWSVSRNGGKALFRSRCQARALNQVRHLAREHAEQTGLEVEVRRMTSPDPIRDEDGYRIAVEVIAPTPSPTPTPDREGAASWTH